MSCPFYGKFAGVLGSAIVEQGGNQCAVVVMAYAPCVMEFSLGLEPNARTCPLLEAAGLLREVYALHARQAAAAFVAINKAREEALAKQVADIEGARR